ncbi:MAG: MoaD/ThiS family protein [Planctomycetota bacterium]
MVVEVKLFATFRQGRFDKKEMEFSKAVPLADLLKDLNIPLEQVGVLLVNGRNTSPEYLLASEDVVSIFPAIGGG